MLRGFPSPLSSRLTSSLVFLWPRIYLLNGSCHSPCPFLIVSHFHLLTTRCFCLLLPCQLWPQFPILGCLPLVFEYKEGNMIWPVSCLLDFLSFHSIGAMLFPCSIAISFTLCVLHTRTMGQLWLDLTTLLVFPNINDSMILWFYEGWVWVCSSMDYTLVNG